MSRRATTSRTGMYHATSAGSMGPPRLSTRPPSAMSRSNEGESRATSPARKSRKFAGGLTGSKRAEQGIGAATDVGESSIQVFVRCRGRSPQEVIAASPIITTTNGPISKMITVETTPLASSSLTAATSISAYGNSHQPRTKTYPFDKVFGPDADQAMIFNEVAEGMLAEVLGGYNCTIFAYGQTGTGKTYTMQGDLELTNLDAPKLTAGIVPRVLHRLFNILESTPDSEYSVKCSYVELYNEELRDLLAREYKGDQNTGGLKLYEDGKKGVMIQGLEETGVRNLKEALVMLEKGVHRRQTAETKMNTESSRSHTIFSITIHVKEIGKERGGEDMLRIGKFNLVDLAGSEAIGRSGATDKRAREAGMINQSLLTLGRVISALVEKGSHIPYRESKLTRLLQDSLGGKTKTCIVATVSPTRSNMEETLSTLDYAIRAKSIRNRPEINAHLTKAGLLKEYIGDIERLKAELAATREKNGIYIPEDQWIEMQVVQHRQKSDFDEAKLKASSIEVALVTIKKEFDEVSVRFLTTVDELARVREAEKSLTDMLDKTKLALDSMKAKLDEEMVVSNAYMEGEERLNVVAGSLRQVATESVSDVAGLFDKIARQTKVLSINADAATNFGVQLQDLSQNLQSDLARLQNAHDDFGQGVRSDMEAFALKGQQATQHDLAALDKSFGSFNDLVMKLSTSNDKGQKEACDFSKSLLSVKDDVQNSLKVWAQHTSERSKTMVEDVLNHQQYHLDAVNNILSSTRSVVDKVLSTAQSHITAELASALILRDRALQTSSSEISHLRSQNDALAQLLAQEKLKTAKLRTELIGSLTSAIENFTDQQDKDLTEVIDRVKTENNKAVRKMGSFQQHTQKEWEEGEQRAKIFDNEIATVKTAGHQHISDGQIALNQTREGLRERLEDYSRDTIKEAEKYTPIIDGFCSKLAKSASNMASKSSTRGKKHSEIIDALSKNVSSIHQDSRARSLAMADSVESLTTSLLESQASSSKIFSCAHSSVDSNLEFIGSSTARFLQAGIQEIVPTGITPQKRAWNVQTNWERTGTREAILADRRKREVIEQSDFLLGNDSVKKDTGLQPESRDNSTTILPQLDSRATSSILSSPNITIDAFVASGKSIEEREMRSSISKKMIEEIIDEPKIVVPILGEAGVNLPRRRRGRG
ncbi:uncharacterized protein L203_101294 [Cryptococcus depauperatus CBS 7841]|uniref:Uncharacterized protein n=1 Tax=Cryptococcus depauperatus CBS 7841 TaxID=1295531 RepID=A0A1E3ICA4_9TREE|nr:kinesin family member 11 [Cryptococcus depauperatus CBS 7841]